MPLSAAADAQQAGTLEVAAGSGRGSGSGPSDAPRVSERPPAPPQFSLWLAPLELQRMVIVRSPSALLAALPGYRDILRGADINPFTQLRTLRVFLPGMDETRLLIAGEHEAIPGSSEAT